MFLTHKQAEVDLGSLFGSEHRMWKSVEHTIHQPWFYVRLVECGGDIELSRMLLVSDAQSLQNLLACQSQIRRVADVMLVTPDHVNGSSVWQMQKLLRAERLVRDTAVAYAYVVDNLAQYVTGNPSARNGSVCEVIYAAGQSCPEP